MSEPAQKRINQTLKNQLSEALDKIEKLEAELEDAWTRAENAARAYRKMKHENKQLLDTLKAIAKCEPNWEPIHIAEKALRGGE